MTPLFYSIFGASSSLSRGDESRRELPEATFCSTSSMRGVRKFQCAPGYRPPPLLGHKKIKGQDHYRLGKEFAIPFDKHYFLLIEVEQAFLFETEKPAPVAVRVRDRHQIPFSRRNTLKDRSCRPLRQATFVAFDLGVTNDSCAKHHRC